MHTGIGLPQYKMNYPIKKNKMEKIKNAVFTCILLISASLSGLYTVLLMFDAQLTMGQHIMAICLMVILSAIATCEIWKNEI